MHLKGFQLLNSVVKILAFVLMFGNEFYFIASPFTYRITMVNLSIRYHCTGTHGISQEFSSKYYMWFFFKVHEVTDIFMNYVRWVKTSDLYFTCLRLSSALDHSFLSVTNIIEINYICVDEQSAGGCWEYRSRR